jgi:hypothetical protein
MNKQRKTSHILNVFQYDADGHVVLPASLTLGIVPGAEDNSGKVPSTAWVRGLLTTRSSTLVPTNRTITINGLTYDLSSNPSFSIDTGVLTASSGVGISVSVSNQNLNIVNTGLLTASSGAGITVSTSNQNVNIVNTGLLTASSGVGITVTTSNQNVNIVNTGLLTASSGSGITVTTSNQNVNIVNTGLLSATAGAGISVSTSNGNLNIVNTITNNNQLDNGAGYATTSYVSTQINNLVAGAPGLLDTLDELAAALGDDANFATTTATSLGNRLRIDTASQGLNSTQQANGRTNLGLGTAALSATGDFVAFRTFGTAANNNTGDFATAAQGTKADTAHGWGNHVSAGYLTSATAASTYVSLTGSYSNPSWITALGWGKITSTPTTISGYGITNAYTDAQIQNFFNGANAITGYNKSNWDTAYGWGNHAVAGYLTTSSAASTYVSLTGSYANPSWITSLAYSKITGVPAFLTSYTETDTLASVTARGASTSTRTTFVELGVTKAGSDTVAAGPWFRWTNVAEDRQMLAQLNASNGLTYWSYNGSAWATAMTLSQAGALSLTGTISASNFSGSSSGTNTGDQTNISGNAATATTATRLGAQSVNLNTGRTPGTLEFYDQPGGTGAPNSSWHNYISTRHGNAGNQYGFQIANEFGSEALLFRGWDGSNPLSWRTLVHSGNVGSYAVTSLTDTLATVTARGSSTSATLTSTNSLGLYVNSGSASYIGINSSSSWSYVSHLNNGTTIWDIGTFNGGQYEIRPYGGSNNRVTVQLNGQFSVNNSQNQVALFQSPNANTWVDIVSTGGTWSMGAAGNNRWALYNRGGTEGTRFEVSTSTAWVNGNIVLHASNFNSYALPLSGGVMTGALVNNTDGAVVMESNASENNNWLWKEASKAWGLFWFNRGTQSGQTIGTYSTVGAELMFMGGSSGIAMPSGWTGHYSGSYIAAMISNWNGYIYSASTVFAATDIRSPRFYSTSSSGTMFSHGAMDDAFGYNGSYGTYIGSVVGGTYYLYANGTFFDNGAIRTFLHSSNFSSYALSLSGGTVSGSLGLAVAPDVRLSVNGDAHISNIVYLGGSAGTVNSWGTRTTGYSGDWTSNVKTVRFDNSGYGTNWSFTINGGGTVQSSGSMIVGTNGTIYSYSAASSGKLYFGTDASDSPQNYNISTSMENVGGNYTKLDFIWYTGQRFYAHYGYGGFRFKEITGGQATLFSIAEGDSNVRVTNTLFIGGNTALHAANYSSYALPISGGTMTGNLTLKFSTANADDYNGITFAPGSNDYIIKASTTRGVFGRSSFGWHVDTTSAFGVYSNGWTKLFGVEGGSGNTQVFGNLSVVSGIDQNNLVGRPYAVWGASGGASGPVVIKFPGNTGNYGMIHAVIDIYEYSGNHAATIIVGGHNWNGGWYNYGAQVIGFTDKPVRVGVKDGKYCIVIGNGSSGWSYGQVILRKIQNGTYYQNIMNVSSGYTAAIESDSYSWISSDLRGLSTPSTFYAGGTISSGSNISSSNNVSISGTSSEPIIITGAMHKYITINPGNGWEAMVRYIGGSGSGWYVGKRTSSQLVGTESFHFYSEAAGATVGGITPSGVLHTTGGATLNGQVNINRHIDANTSWGSCGCTSIFVGWSGGKVILGNSASGGHDYANGLGSNTVVSTNPFFCYQDITAYSDSRVKENVEVIEDAIEKVKAIRGVTFTRNDVEDLNKRHAGVIAQEILEVLPEAVSEDSRGHLSVAYGNLTSLLIEAIKEQQLQIEKLQNKLDNVLSSR